MLLFRVLELELLLELLSLELLVLELLLKSDPQYQSPSQTG